MNISVMPNEAPKYLEDFTYKMEGLIIQVRWVFWVHRNTAVPAPLTVLYINPRRFMYGFTYIKLPHERREI